MKTKKSPTYSNFSIVRHRSNWNTAQLPDGTTVTKAEKFLIPEMGGFIPCAPYDDHFLYEIPERLASLYPGSIYRCTCGGAAIVVSYNGYFLDASPQGKMFVCTIHSHLGKHATGGEKWI